VGTYYPNGTSVSDDEVLHVTDPAAWASNRAELVDALRASGHPVPVARGLRPVGGIPGARNIPKPEDRLVCTVEEVAQLLGISRSFAYEAVQKGLVPSMRIGRRILVPKAALERFLLTVTDVPAGE
jgi:excisionase family DNA binding protein